MMCLAEMAFGQHYNRTDLTADMAATSPSAANLDPNLVNAWGLARSSTSFFWISDNGTGLTTLYTGAGVPQSLVVKIPTADGTGTSAPTGAVFNYSTGFLVGGTGTAAVFLFCTEDGTIAAWNPGVDRTNAVLKVKRGGKAVYKGCALAQTNRGVFLYATNFLTGRVEVFDSSFTLVATKTFQFGDDDDHGHNGNGFAPFNIQNVGGNLVVTFAKKQAGSNDEQHGPGLGAVGIFDANGKLLSRLQRGNFLNAPWGIALAPSDFGPFSHRLLIGNFGDGTVNAFNVVTGQFEGKMLATGSSSPLVVDGLWALSFGGNSTNNGSATELFFTAGPNDEGDGLFGKITATNSEQRGNTE
jgi:uncharacterized protein (TIGR03118 family)